MEKKRVVLVTGASSGIGEATALLLANSGYIVYGAARRVEKMKHLELAGIHILPMDISNDESIVLAVNEVITKEGAIDILINNAGFGSFGAVEDVAMKDARYQIEVNVIGLARLSQLVLPYMRKQHYGKIINVTSIGGKMATPMGGWYHASKFAVEGLSDSLRMEVKQFGVDVILIEPGGVKTEWGTIAANYVSEISGNTAYKKMADKAKEMDAAQETYSEPIEIARVIKKAMEVSKPKARYSAGRLSGLILFLKRWLSDAAFDKFTMRRFK
ncbi:SDR family NAD(P)-dependent oxidoreductase [Mucilaginibacter sp. HC2]|uniref:oxidoreductase n=1 Tax=Mucilaginibacter inviolabilis TaxID=2714892 RepID=UPI00140A945F|nr:oxidoreductase [Mucilaginibacter inviolabilis]NHA02892.1 SDR family NAD(P)-dependent oxidoreductase [Mucilaginibacter inviolabilis]